MEELQRRIEKFRPDVLILDPLVEMHGAEENDNGALRMVVAQFRAMAVKYNMAVILLHHTRKGASASPGDPDTSRGASSIVGAARVVLTVTTMGEDDAKAFGVPPDARRHYFRLDSAKSNYSPLDAEEWFEKVGYGLENGEQVAAAVPWTPPDDIVTQEKQVAIEIAVAKGSPKGPWAKRLSDDSRSIKQLLLAHGVTTARGQKKVIDSLTASGFTVARFKGHDRHPADGFRHPDGRPSNVEWLED
jgi:AAA domain